MPAFSERHCCGCDCVTVLHKELVVQLVDRGSAFFHRQNLKVKRFILNVIETRTRTVVLTLSGKCSNSSSRKFCLLCFFISKQLQ